MSFKKNICFVANDYKFFFRHFSLAVQAAEACEANPIALLPTEKPEHTVQPPGVQVVPSPIDRGLTVGRILQQLLWLIRQLRGIQPKAVVVFSIRGAVVIALARPFIRNTKIIVYVTGLGLLSLLSNPKARAIRAICYFLIRTLGYDRRNYFIFENETDRPSLGFGQSHPHRRTRFWGAGVDQDEFNPREFPSGAVLRLASVSRLVWSKGIDLAVQAVLELSNEGHAVTLDIYGDPDRGNPRPIDPSHWLTAPSVRFLGFVDDVNSVWAQHHAGIFASRGGEGLPRALMEAAACGRPSIVTDVPGCSDFVINDVTGYLAQPNSVSSLKAAIRRMLETSERLPEMGNAARERFLGTGTARATLDNFQRIFTSALQ
jgi:glycosyltransferase involved in cell wall biosynthesis